MLYVQDDGGGNALEKSEDVCTEERMGEERKAIYIPFLILVPMWMGAVRELPARRACDVLHRPNVNTISRGIGRSSIVVQWNTYI